MKPKMTGRIRFTISGEPINEEWGWSGEWPPPQELYLVTGRITGERTVAEVEHFDAYCDMEPSAERMLDVARFHQTSASHLPDSLMEEEPSRVIRYALYELSPVEIRPKESVR